MKSLMKKSLLSLVLLLALLPAAAQEMLFDDGWKFAFGNASSPAKDFGRGTEYFNYFTKAASIHNEGPYAVKFDDSAWKPVQLPHDWVVDLPFSPEASHSHGYKTVGWKWPETSVGAGRGAGTARFRTVRRHFPRLGHLGQRLLAGWREERLYHGDL